MIGCVGFVLLVILRVVCLFDVFGGFCFALLVGCCLFYLLAFVWYRSGFCAVDVLCRFVLVVLVFYDNCFVALL